MVPTMADAGAADDLETVRRAPLNASGQADYALRCEMHSCYLASTDSVGDELETTLIIPCVLCFISAGVGTYNWMRWRQYLVFN
ncbi:hypothetical protein IOCL2690_000506200 [Leishmania lindenbergi]|uniref:Uncharacterized protein n=1 Tax=Leishmania lindenbergi TaxID=651832 RepID=A0AAW3AAC7_9TRYP